MLITTCNLNVDYQALGLVKGSSMKAVHVGKDILASFRILFGGQVTEYAKLIEDTRDEAIKKMTEEAEKMGANAIIEVRFATSSVAQGASEIIAYGTAVKI